MIERTLFTPDHEAFRDSFRRFMDKEIAPFHEAWEEQGYVDARGLEQGRRERLSLHGAARGAYGGAGADKLYSVMQFEELGRAASPASASGCTARSWRPIILRYGTEAQKKNYLPKLASGEMIGAIAMSEPAAGSDLQAVRSTALKQPDGSYLLNGSKTFITNGWHADLVIVVAKTDPAGGAKGTSLFLVERGVPGFEKGQRLKKLGLKAQDTSELFFNDVRLPAEALLGEENRGFACLMEQLPWERLQIAISAVAAAQAAIDHTVAYVKERKVFGQPVAAYQNTRYTLAELQTEVQVAQVFVDKCIELLMQDKLDTATASMAKYWTTDLQCKVMDECVQLHGGYGYMWEYPVTRAYADARVQRIYGGTNEIMKEVITRAMGLPGR
jgi:alkylation response protein AidB-like acyl-CoA dehydrogenase